MTDSRRFVPDPPPAAGDPVLMEWLVRQLERVAQSLAQIDTKQDGGEGSFEDHIGDKANPHETRHDNLADGQFPVEAHWPPGGVIDQIAAKASASDYDLIWKDYTASVTVKGEVVPGTGNVWDDANAHCFAGPDSDGNCRMCIGPSDLLYIGHGGVTYLYLGPREVCIGSGGAGGTYPHRITVQADWAPSGTTSHIALTERDAADSHPQSAVGGRGAEATLLLDQDKQDNRLTNLEAALPAHANNKNNPHAVQHAQLSDRGTNDHAEIDAHIADTLIHFQDVPLDGIGYIRRDRAWIASVNLAVMYGLPTDKTLGTGGFRVDGWSNVAESGLMVGSGNATTGQFVIPATGIYRFVAHLHGDQGNDNKEESIWLDFRQIGGSDPGYTEVCHESVDTDKTSGRTLGATAVRQYDAGTILELRMRASTGLGTFSFIAATWELEKIL